MTDLAEFLLLRIAEDEEAAREANCLAGWLTFRETDGSLRYTAVGQMRPGGPWIVDGRAVEERPARIFYDWRRVLAECDAKRHIVERAQAMEYAGAQLVGTQMAGILADLAGVYAGHPDFQSEWAR